MVKVTYKTYSKILNKEFINTKTVKSLDDFNLFNLALFHGQAVILETENV